MELHPKAVGIMIENKLTAHDLLEHEGQKYVVVLWYANPDEGLRRPQYVLPLEKVAHQEVDDHSAPFPVLVNDPLPKALFDGTADRALRRRYGVQLGPSLELPLKQTTH